MSTHFFGIDWRISNDHRSDTVYFFLYWIFASPIILTSFDAGIPLLNLVIYFTYMIVGYTVSAWLIINVVFPTFFGTKRYLLAMVGMLAVLVGCAIGSHLLAEWMQGTDYNFWIAVFKWELPNDSQNILTLAAILLGKKYITEKQRSIQMESERRQSELQRLRAQVDPHFLFNSLNILDILIDDDPATAKVFVHRLSNLYRYLIRHRDEDLVPAADELAYAQDYNFLVEQRFGAAFRFRQNINLDGLQGLYLPPGSLQTVLENVYKHNLATERNPVTITIDQRGDSLFVTNDFSPKPGELATHERSGSGTANLLRRFALLTDNEVYARQEGAHWVAKLPLLRVGGAVVRNGGSVQHSKK